MVKELLGDEDAENGGFDGVLVDASRWATLNGLGSGVIWFQELGKVRLDAPCLASTSSGESITSRVTAL